MSYIAKRSVRQRSSALAAVLVFLTACVVALLVGLLLPVLPVRFSLFSVGAVLLALGMGVVLLLPDQKTVPYGVIFTVLLVALVTRFLWPNYAYLPIPVLPTKNPQRLIWALAIAYWLYSLATNAELRQRLASRCTQSKTVWLIFALFGWRVLSVGFSDFPATSAQRVVLEFFDYLPALLFILTWVRNGDDVLRLGRWLTFATLIVCTLALVEAVMQRNLFLTITPFDPSNEEFLQSSLESKVRGGAYRTQASFNHPLLLAQFLSVTLPIVMLTARADASRWMRRLAIVILLLLPAVLYTTHTRTAVGVSALIAALAIAMLTLQSMRSRQVGQDSRRNLAAGVMLMVMIGVGAVIVALVVLLAVGRTTDESVSSYARLQMLDRAIVGASQQPIVGAGPAVGGAEAANINSRGRSSLDSLWLVLLLESGVPALLLYLALLAKAISPVFAVVRGGLPGTAQTSAAWALAVLAFALTSLVLGTPHNLPLLYLALGVLIVLDLPAAPATGRAPARQRYR